MPPLEQVWHGVSSVAVWLDARATLKQLGPPKLMPSLQADDNFMTHSPKTFRMMQTSCGGLIHEGPGREIRRSEQRTG